MTDLTQEQVLAQLQTRGFETGGFRSPLRWFRGTLTGIIGSMVQRGNMQQPRLEVTYNFQNQDVEVFESSEPYPWPIAQISIMHSNREKSNMGVLGRSIDKIINAGVDENLPQAQAKNQDILIGKVQEWKVTPGHMMWDNDKQAETARECFEVVYVEGIGGTPHSGVMVSTEPPDVGGVQVPTPTASTVISPTQQALNLLDGKTQQEWNNIVFQDPLVKGDPAVVKSIIDGVFIPPLEASGMVTKDADGRYHIKND